MRKAVGLSLIGVMFLALPALAETPLEVVRASYFGTAEDDNFEGAAAGEDGSLYLVGNAGAKIDDLPGRVKPVTFGDECAGSNCGCGFVLKLSKDGGKIRGYAEFGKGILHATGIAVTKEAVYVGGFASHGLEPLLKGKGGLIQEYPLRAKMEDLRKQQEEAEAAGKPRKDPLAGRPWLQRLGAPCVLKLSLDLGTLEGGTYLEGWEQVYDKKRVCGHVRRDGKRKGYVGRFREFFWQPINICPLKSGDVVVSHDGGYFRNTTDADREKVEAAAKEEKDRKKLLERLGFYDVPDHVSRLSGDLRKRKWKTEIATPPTDPKVAGKLKNGWYLTHFGNPRIHRMRMDSKENLWVGGWSATLTSNEPWWSPFLWRLDAKTGEPTKRFYEYDPMSGGGNRMGGTVADTAVLSVAVEEDDDLLVCLISDGGNSHMFKGPKGNDGEKMKGPVIGPTLIFSPCHFWGQVHRVSWDKYDGLGGAKTGPWAWTIDAAGAPDNHFLALGRWNHKLPWTEDAWWTDKEAIHPNPNAFLRVVGPDHNTTFWTAIPGVRPFEVVSVGDKRYVVTGFADGGSAPKKDGLVEAPIGKRDAWFMIVEWE